MSDVWQGPGWWLASDGKWYPEDGGPETEGDTSTPDTAVAVDDAPGGAHEVVTGVVEDAPADGTPTGGWEAVVPTETADDLDGWTEPAIIEHVDGSTPTELAEPEPELAPAVPADDVGGWTPAAEVPEVEPPVIDLAAGAAAAAAVPDVDAPAPADLGAVAGDIPEVNAPTTVPVEPRPTVEALERDEAWRKPGEAPIGTDAPPATSRPGVVDIGAEEVAETEIDLAAPAMEPTTARVLTGLLGLLIVGLIVGLIWLLFLRGDDDSDVDSTDAPATTESTAPVDDSTDDSSESTETTAAPDDEPDSGTTAVTTADDTVPGEIAVFELRNGDCIEGNIGSGQVQRLVVVDCDQPHEFEVYREVLIDDSISAFDEEAISAQAEDVCRTALAAYIPDADERNIKFKWFQPTEESWNQPENPDRVITCLLFDEDGPLTGKAG